MPYRPGSYLFQLAQIGQNHRGVIDELWCIGRRQIGDSLIKTNERRLDRISHQRRQKFAIGAVCAASAHESLCRFAVADTRYRSRRPLQYFFEHVSSAFTRPGAPLLEADQRSRVDDPLTGELALRDPEFAPPSCDGRAGTSNARVRCAVFHGVSVTSRYRPIGISHPQKESSVAAQVLAF